MSLEEEFAAAANTYADQLKARRNTKAAPAATTQANGKAFAAYAEHAIAQQNTEQDNPPPANTSDPADIFNILPTTNL